MKYIHIIKTKTIQALLRGEGDAYPADKSCNPFAGVSGFTLLVSLKLVSLPFPSTGTLTVSTYFNGFSTLTGVIFSNSMGLAFSTTLLTGYRT